jgi:hypothetical protein
MELAFGLFFFVCWCMCMGGIIHGLYEYSRLRSDIYARGPLVLDFRDPFPYSPVTVKINQATKGDYCKYVFLSETECLLREKLDWNPFQWRTGMFIKGTINFSNGIAEIKGRLPVGPIIFAIAWTLMWILGWSFAMREDFAVGLGALLFGLTIMGVIATVAVPISKKRFQKAYAELKGRLRR